MGRSAHLCLGIATILLCVIWCLFGLIMFLAAAAGLDGRGAGLDHPDFIEVYVVFGGGLLGGLWFALRSFRRAFKSPRSGPAVEKKSAPSGRPGPQKSAETPDERLAHLVKKPKDENRV